MDTSPLLWYSMDDDLFRSQRLVRHSPPPLCCVARLLRLAIVRRMRLREVGFGEVGWGSGGSGSLGSGSDVEDYGSEQGMADDETR